MMPWHDYLHVLVNVFKTVLLSGEHAHLDNFYIIVRRAVFSSPPAQREPWRPPRCETNTPLRVVAACQVPALCISWVESSLLAKDRMYKQQVHRTSEAYYADDGFALGIAYVLAILEQGSRFDSLHWFKVRKDVPYTRTWSLHK
jgi:WASH complex subunit 7